MAPVGRHSPQEPDGPWRYSHTHTKSHAMIRARWGCLKGG